LESAGAVLKICPRCGLPYSYIEERETGSNTYYYAVHYYTIGKRRVKKRCYLGPEVYKYVSKTHFDVGLHFKGLVDSERLLYYLREIVVGVRRRIVVARSTGRVEVLEGLSDYLRMASEEFNRLAREVEELKRKLEELEREE
jgi:hypothetical protein